MSYRHNADFSFVRSRDLYNKYVTRYRRLNLRQPILSCFVEAAMLVCAVFIFASLSSESASAQARVDLEDLSVKGELLNDNRLRMSSREATRIQDRVKYRKNFRPEIIDGSDVRVPAAEALDEVEAK